MLASSHLGKGFGGQIICPGIILLEFGELIDFELVFILSVLLDGQIPIQAAVFSSPSGWRDIGVLFVENRHLEMLLL